MNRRVKLYEQKMKDKMTGKMDIANKIRSNGKNGAICFDCNKIVNIEIQYFS